MCWNFLNLGKEDVKHITLGGGVYLPQIAKPWSTLQQPCQTKKTRKASDLEPI